MSEVAQYAQFALLASALVYFWTVMFERFSRSCSALAGLILIGVAGRTLIPGAANAAFDLIATIGISALLLARSWLIWKEWHDV
jgi:hypothetical protein